MRQSRCRLTRRDSVLSLIFIAICVFFLATFNSILYSVTVFVMTVTGLTEMSERN